MTKTPTPAEMAREAYPGDGSIGTRAAFAAGVQAERDRAALRTGRPRAAPTTEDGRLVEEVRARTKLTQGALEDALGCGSGVLSKVRAGERPLPDEHRERLRGMLSGAPTARPTKKK